MSESNQDQIDLWNGRVGGKARLVQADASVWRADAPFDLAVSQFGLMFFADPAAAFATLADRDRLGGSLARAGFADVAIEPCDFPVCFARDGGVEAVRAG